MKKLILAALSFYLAGASGLSAHCQMPCGIYHDDMVYDQIDQYVETMYKACAILSDNKFQTPRERMEFTRWVYNKEKLSDEAANLILTYFLQQKIKPGESDTTDKVLSAQKLLFLMVQIKQNCDQKIILQFGEEWEHFKDLFHPEGYECQVELQKCIKRDKQERDLYKSGGKASTGATGGTGSTGAAVNATKPNVAVSDHEHNHDHDHDHDHSHTH